VFSSGHQVSEQFTHTADKPTFESVAALFLRLADLRLSSTQKTVLRMSAQLLEHHCLTVTGLADLLLSNGYWACRSAIPTEYCSIFDCEMESTFSDGLGASCWGRYPAQRITGKSDPLWADASCISQRI